MLVVVFCLRVVPTRTCELVGERLLCRLFEGAKVLSLHEGYALNTCTGVAFHACGGQGAAVRWWLLPQSELQSEFLACIQVLCGMW